MAKPVNPHAGDAGHIRSRFNPVTSGWLTLYDADEQGIDVKPDRFAVLCQLHGTMVGARSKAFAASFLTFPEFCEECVQLHEEFDKLRARIIEGEPAAEEAPARLKAFSGENYSRNSDRAGVFHPCALCGKKVTNPRFGVEVVNGNEFVRADTPNLPALRAASDYMAFYPVGNDCRRALEANGVVVSAWQPVTA